MKKSLVLIVLMCVMVSIGFSQASNSGNITKTITGMEKKITELIKKGDWDTFKSHVSSEFLGVYSFGISNRDEELESLQNLKMDTYEMSDIQVIQPAENVAIIAYKLTASGSYMDEEFSGAYFASSTYVKQNGEWKGVMHTEADAEEMDHDVDSDMDMDMDSDSLNVSVSAYLF